MHQKPGRMARIFLEVPRSVGSFARTRGLGSVESLGTLDFRSLVTAPTGLPRHRHVRALFLETGAHASRVSAAVSRRSPSLSVRWVCDVLRGDVNASTVPREDAGNSTRDACAPSKLTASPSPPGGLSGNRGTRVPRVGCGVPPQPVSEACAGSAMIQGMA